jgi:hypothetical protein
MACKVALYNVIDKLIANKPYISFNKEHGVIDVKNSVTNRINNNNRAAITYSFANQLNKKIKDLIKDKTLGDILYVNWENNVPYILVGPTDRQLNIINNQLSNNTSEVVKKDFEKEKFLRETALRQKRANEYIDDVGDVYPTLQDAIAASNRKEIENNVNNFITLEEAEQVIKDLYPEITPYFDITGKPNFKEDKDVFNQKEDNVQNQRNENNRIIGQADIKAGTVLIDMLRRKKDTIPHEYAHHYIAWFRNAPIVQEAIKKWGSEETLVQAIGEQAVKQKGEAWDWWTKFKQWIGTLFENLSGKQKEELAQILTDAFLSRADLETGGTLTSERINELRKRASKGIYNQKLEELKSKPDFQINSIQQSLNKPNTNPILQSNQQEQVKKFTELQERLSNKEFLEGAKNAYENSEELQNVYYEASGFSKQINEIADTKKVDEFIKKYKNALPNIKDGKTLISHLQTISNRNTGTTKQFADLIIKLSQQNKSLEKLLNNPNLYAKPDGVGDEGAFHWSLFNNLSVNKIVLELNHFKTNTYDDVFLHELIHNLTTQFIVKDSDLFNQDFYNKVKELYSVFDNHLENNKKINEPLLKSTKDDVKNIKRLIEYFNVLPSDAIQHELIFGKIGSISTVKDVKLDFKSLENKSKEDVLQELNTLLGFKENRVKEIEKGNKDYYYFNSKTFKQENVLSEFLATFMNDAKFREQLKNIEYKNNKSIFQKIIDLIGDFLGLTKNESLYNEFVLNLTKFINDNDYSSVAQQTVRTAYENRINLLEQQKQDALNAYTDYIARVSLGIIKNPSSGEYNYESQVKDIVYRGKTKNQTNKKSKELGIFFTDNKNAANIYAIKYKGDEFDDSVIQGIVNKFGLNPTIEQIKSEIAFFEKMGATKEQIEKDAKEFQKYILNNKGISEQAILNIKNPKNLIVKDWFDNYDNSSGLRENADGLLLKGGKQSDNRIYDAGENQIVVFEPEQIHILGSKQDIKGFKEFVNRQNNTTSLVNVNIDLENKPITKNDIINSDVFHELITQMVSNNEINKNCK